ncbi:E3 ubiquitin-protein ligase Fancl [Cydia amplana]|uniref:E3 ubiquitin-protein ligase Fancl n=1 Tax=Cydia amplana TaxID=1869771 RepID=UPI002FE61036
MENKIVVDNIFHSEKYNSLTALVSELDTLLYKNLHTSDTIAADLLDADFIEEIRTATRQNDVVLHFGTTLRELKCVITDESAFRDHTVFIRYEGPKKLCVIDASIPHAALQDKEYKSIKDIVKAFEEHVNALSGYFYELERIDRYCTVMEPAKPSFRDDFRRILLDDRTWLHVEVTSKGCAANIHLLGHSEHWHDKLQAGLLNWDHDKDIVENITTMFDIASFPVMDKPPTTNKGSENSPEEVVCNICLCSELPEIPGVPQPLCQNPQCVVYFHRSCLFQWLVACSGGRPPVFGVATGSCPTCLNPTTCNENDN